jgi:hypothetical protein
MITIARRMPSSSETPDGFVRWSSNAFFSASAAARLAASLEASSASARASFCMKSFAVGSKSSGLLAMSAPFRKLRSADDFNLRQMIHQ